MNYKYNDGGQIIEASDGTHVWMWTYSNDLLVAHTGPSISWTKEYDEQGREIKYTCGDIVVTTWYDEDGTRHSDGDEDEGQS